MLFSRSDWCCGMKSTDSLSPGNDSHHTSFSSFTTFLPLSLSTFSQQLKIDPSDLTGSEFTDSPKSQSETLVSSSFSFLSQLHSGTCAWLWEVLPLNMLWTLTFSRWLIFWRTWICPPGYLFIFPRCLPPRWNAQLSGPPVRPLMSSALPAALTQTGRLPTENTSNHAPTRVDDTPGSSFSN